MDREDLQVVAVVAGVVAVKAIFEVFIIRLIATHLFDISLSYTKCLCMVLSLHMIAGMFKGKGGK